MEKDIPTYEPVLTVEAEKAESQEQNETQSTIKNSNLKKVVIFAVIAILLITSAYVVFFT